MMDSYEKILKLRQNAKSSQNYDLLKKINMILFPNRNKFIKLLVENLKENFNTEYFCYTITDINNNIADIIVKKDSQLFKTYINNTDYLNFDIENIIDKRLFNNFNEILIVNLNFNKDFLDLSYLYDSLQYYYLSYSEELKNNLIFFINSFINENFSIE